MNNVVLLGLKSSKPGGQPLTPVGRASSTADRLRIICRLSVKEFIRKFPYRLNVENRSRGKQLFETLSGTVYVFGLDAWRCLGLKRVPFFERLEFDGTSYMLLPHPSGRNHLYNLSSTRLKVRRILCRH